MPVCTFDSAIVIANRSKPTLASLLRGQKNCLDNSKHDKHCSFLPPPHIQRPSLVLRFSLGPSMPPSLARVVHRQAGDIIERMLVRIFPRALMRRSERSFVCAR